MLYKSKAQWITDVVEGKNVLDLGCVCHDLEQARRPEWLHRVITNAARSVVGVDYLKHEVEILKAMGYDVVCANVENMRLGETFDVIVAGDLIEHLSNYGLFMQTLTTHLAPGGQILISTPNPVNLLRFCAVLLRGCAGANPEHTCWFTAKVLDQLARRYGFEVARIGYVDDSYQYYPRRRWWPFFLLNFLLCRFRHEFAETLCVVLTIRNDNAGNVRVEPV